MGKVQIHTLWGWRKGETGPELMVAWDEFCVDENWDGYAEDKERAIKSWGSDLWETREMLIAVDYDLVRKVFETPTVDGVVTN